MEARELIGLDLGQKHTGIARASTIAKVAEPLKTVPTERLIKELKELINQGQIEAIVVGLPRNLSGDDTDQTKWVRQWVGLAKEQLKIPMYWSDEALTSRESRPPDHTGAATTILQDFLNTSAADRQVC